MKKIIPVILYLFVCMHIGFAQKSNVFSTLQNKELKYNYQSHSDFITKIPSIALSHEIASEVNDGVLYAINDSILAHIFKTQPELLTFSITDRSGVKQKVNLYKAQVLSEDFELFYASNKQVPVDITPPIFYRGVIEGNNESSLVSINIMESEMSGLLLFGDETYNFGPLESNKGIYILYKDSDGKNSQEFNCMTDANSPNSQIGGSKSRIDAGYLVVGNCVRLYTEIDNDIYLDKGSDTKNHLMGLLAQVFTLYANEEITILLQEMLIWDVVDPHTGPASDDYLYGFVNKLNGQYDGDIAKLIGYRGGGGIAFVDVVCNKPYALGYSDISNSYDTVPQYSWSVMVLTHEIGHILGSNHTHDCVWGPNGNEAIDRCASEADPSFGDCDPNAPVPYADGGTIMSYCHLIGTVGVNFNNGFGLEPGNLIRGRVRSANCLTSCFEAGITDAGISNIVSPKSSVCVRKIKPTVELTNYGGVELCQVEIYFEVVGANVVMSNWEGLLTEGQSTVVTLPEISLPVGNVVVKSFTRMPNNIIDFDFTNDGRLLTMLVDQPMVYYEDTDGDGYGDLNAIVTDCPKPEGYVINAQDCDDNDSDISPDATEVCNGFDDNCDGQIDEGLDRTWYADADGDGYGDAGDKRTQCSQPLGYIGDSTDCDDNESDISPDATEVCNGFDDNCDGQIDEGLDRTWYADADGDGYGDAGDKRMQCSQPLGYIGDSTDCDDNEFDISPDATEVCNGFDDNCDGQIDEGLDRTWYADADGDGYGDAGDKRTQCSQPLGYIGDSTDCDDNESDISPDATEVCNGFDDNCDGQIDEGLDRTWYADADGDGYGDAGDKRMQCSQPLGYIGDSTDCDDNEFDISPDATEVCNGFDDNCDGQIDEGLDRTWYADADGDGYGDAGDKRTQCSQPLGYIGDSTDCDDNESDISPDATEVCNGFDDNCDGQIDEGLDRTWYADADGDGYGDAGDKRTQCSQPLGYIGDSTDCDDNESDISPDATEVCNGFDDNCDGQIDEGLDRTWYADADGDGYGDAGDKRTQCSQPLGYIGDSTDCDDNESDISPDATEVCNGFDDNCDGHIDEGLDRTWYADADGDGYGDANVSIEACANPNGYVANNSDCSDLDASIHPNAKERCNDYDDNCNGKIDENAFNPPKIDDIIFLCLDDYERKYCVDVQSGVIVKWSHGSKVYTEKCIDLILGKWSVEYFDVESNCIVRQDFLVKYTTLEANLNSDDSTIIVTGGSKPYRDTIMEYGSNIMKATVTDNDGCTVSDSVLISSTYSISTSDNITIFPNPTNNDIYIQSDLNIFFNVEVISITGKVLGRCEKCKVIQFDSLEEGVYYLRISDAEKSFQIMKQVVKL